MPFEKQAAGKDAILFADEKHGVYAISKPPRGESYRLDKDRFECLVQSVRYARVRLKEILLLLARFDGTAAANMVVEGPAGGPRRLSPLGLLADHFNLINVRQWHEWKPRSELGVWHYPLDFEAKAKTPDLLNLVNTVKAVFQATSDGLASDVLFRGLAGSDESLDGKVRFRTDRAIGPDTFFPESLRMLSKEEKLKAKGKTLPDEKRQKILSKLPKLEDDDVFLNPQAQAKGFIHLNYMDLTTVKGPIGLELIKRTPMFWVIVHEATHKFARTRDVHHPNSYSIEACRNMHWLHALRNAQHYMRFAGMNWEQEPLKSDRVWQAPVKDMLAEPHT